MGLLLLLLRIRNSTPNRRWVPAVELVVVESETWGFHIYSVRTTFWKHVTDWKQICYLLPLSKTTVINTVICKFCFSSVWFYQCPEIRGQISKRNIVLYSAPNFLVTVEPTAVAQMGWIWLDTRLDWNGSIRSVDWYRRCALITLSVDT